MKIAFLFLIYGDINHEDMWYRFFKGVDKSKYSIYIHYKFDTVLKYFEEYKLKNCISTNYGDISLVYAQQFLLSKALEDESNTKFVFISNSCIPLKSFDYVYEKLTKNENSYFGISTGFYFPHSFINGLNFSTRDVCKASQWCILNREHAKICSSDKVLVYHFKNIFAPEEYYFLSVCKKLCDKNIINEHTTFVNWDEVDEDNDCSPKTYYCITQKELNELKSSSHLFARKFSKECYVSVPIKNF